MKLAEKQEQLTAELAALKNGQDRLAFLVAQAKRRAPLASEDHVDARLIPGCLAKLWFVPHVRDGHCFFLCDSDSLVVKAIAGLLCDFYSGQAPTEILAHDPGFLAPLGITQHLTPNRRNALSKVWERIRQFAIEEIKTFGISSPAMKLYDAHNHLQDDRFHGRQDELLAACTHAGVTRMVVNGACEGDWPQVLALARQHPVVLPSFGYHPWYVSERTADWLRQLETCLDQIPSAVGEIGLDRWKPELPYAHQEEVFLAQLRLAAQRNLPVSIHCLRTWGRLHELLRDNERPARGFVLHSFGGPVEMVPTLARLGAYFSFPGYFLHARKLRQRETFQHVPPDRLLLETDAPDQHLPPGQNHFPLADADGQPLNHPANLFAVYAGLAGFLGEKVESLAARVEENFLRLFGGLA